MTVILIRLNLLLALFALSVFSSTNASTEEWTQEFEAGLRAYNVGNIDDARTSWTAALVEASGPEARSQILDWLASLEERAGHVGKAETHLRDKVTLLQDTTGFDRLHLAAARSSLAAFLERRGRLDEAEEILRGNIKLYETLVSGNWTADPHLALARFHERQGDLVSAAHEFRAALTWIGEEDPGLYARTLEDYAHLLSRMQLEEDSEKARKEAKRIRDNYSVEIEENRRRIPVTEERSQQ